VRVLTIGLHKICEIEFVFITVMELIAQVARQKALREQVRINKLGTIELLASNSWRYLGM